MPDEEYIPRWKIEMEQEKEKIAKEVTEEVIKGITKAATEATEIIMLNLMKENGIPEGQIRAIAKQRKVSMEIVDIILTV